MSIWGLNSENSPAEGGPHKVMGDMCEVRWSPDGSPSGSGRRERGVTGRQARRASLVRPRCPNGEDRRSLDGMRTPVPEGGVREGRSPSPGVRGGAPVGRAPSAARDRRAGGGGTRPTAGPSGRALRSAGKAQKALRAMIDFSIMALDWSGWRDLNPRPLRPERSALPSCATPRCVKTLRSLAPRRVYRTLGGDRESVSGKAGGRQVRRGVSVRRVASGGQQKRNGAVGEVPRPALMWSQESWWRWRPLTRSRSMPQLVARAP